MNYDYEKIGKRIKAERKAHGMTQENFSAAYRVKRSTVSKWEHGETIPSFQTMLDMCKDFDCELGYLLCENGYENRTREATDICEATGLSEEAVRKLVANMSENENSISPFVSEFISKCDKIINCISEMVICNLFDKNGSFKIISKIAEGKKDKHRKKAIVDGFIIEYIDKEEMEKEISKELKQKGFSETDMEFLRAITLGYLCDYKKQIDLDIFTITNAFVDIVKAYVKEGAEDGRKDKLQEER